MSDQDKPTRDFLVDSFVSLVEKMIDKYELGPETEDILVNLSRKADGTLDDLDRLYKLIGKAAELLDRIKKGEEYLARDGLTEAQKEKGVRTYEALTEELSKHVQAMQEAGDKLHDTWIF